MSNVFQRELSPETNDPVAPSVDPREPISKTSTLLTSWPVVVSMCAAATTLLVWLLFSPGPIGLFAAAIVAGAAGLGVRRGWRGFAERIAQRNELLRVEAEAREAEAEKERRLRGRREDILNDLSKAHSLDRACSVLLRHLVPAVRLGFSGIFFVRKGDAELQAWRGLSRKPRVEMTIDQSFLFRASKHDTVRVDAKSLRRSEFIQGLRLPPGTRFDEMTLFRIGDPAEAHWLLAYSQTLLDDEFADIEERDRWLRELFDDVEQLFEQLHEDAVLAVQESTQRFVDKTTPAAGQNRRPGDIASSMHSCIHLLKETLGIDRVALYVLRNGTACASPTTVTTSTVPPAIERRWCEHEQALLSRRTSDSVELLNSERLRQAGIDSLISAAAVIPVTWRDAVAAVVIASHRSLWKPTAEEQILLPTCGTQIAALLEEAVRQAEKNRTETQADTRQREEFLAKISHELRTPVTGILGMTDLFMETDLSPEQREYVAMVKSSSSSLMDLLNDVLDLSKIEAGGMRIEQTGFPLRRIVADAARSLAVAAHQKGVDFCLRIAPDVPEYVTGDPLRLRQVLTNLIGNAIKYTSDGEIVVRVRREEGTDDGCRLWFEVRDTGPGIPAEARERIFEKYEQTDVSDSRKHGGTGLGLPICKELVELMGGTIGVDSKEGVGSLFRASIPFVSCGPEERRPRAGVLRANALFVDDHPGTCEAALEFLKRHVDQITAATSAEAALAQLETMSADDSGKVVVMIDSHLPGAARVANAARERFADRAVTIVQLHAMGSPAPTDHDAIPLPDATVLKPIDPTDLLTAIEPPEPFDSTATDSAKGDPMHDPVSPDRPLQILLAEDEKVNRLLAKRMVQAAGHVPVVVEDGDQAVAAMKRQSFDLILMDLNMPRMDGVEATRAIRDAEANGRHTPIICLTASTFEHDRARCLDAGMDGFCTKPLTVDAVRQAIAEHLHRPVDANAVAELSNVLEVVRSRS